MGFTTYSGPWEKYPPKSEWKSLDDIFAANKSEMLKTGDTESDVDHIRTAVDDASHLGVEGRVIFCIIMQESSGNVGMKTTIDKDGGKTAGLMQCHGSPGFPGQHGLTQVCILMRILEGSYS
jgi:hypothetical protein